MIFFIVAYILKGSKMKFGDIIRDPSLARFQFLVWTFIVMFAVLSVYFIELFMGKPTKLTVDFYSINNKINS